MGPAPSKQCTAVVTIVSQLVTKSGRVPVGKRAGAADMDGYQFLPTSHSIRAYLAVLYRL
jgi:hypothetical protein